ncbi:MAG: AAA family ATPase [Lachnospiraceae bacterium]|nr:AAA family ATPase [Lachnospiraceae bacterium]
MKKIGIGYENYKEFVDQKLYYVDKTLFIRDIVEKGGKVTLFTRPRRFGKTLALSMLRTFFEAELDKEGNPVDNRRYFEGMKIMGCGEEILSKQGQYPVINLTLKSAKQQRFSSAVLRLREEIVSEFERHAYVLDSDRLSEDLKKDFRSFRSANSIWREKEGQFRSKEETEEALLVEAGRFSTSLKTLSECLKLYHGKNVVMLIDEYDVPLENAYFEGFYQEMSGFIRSLFESAVKTNDSLELAVITGCLRISRESIFTGLNNLEVCSIRSLNFGEHFGFTTQETLQMLADYELMEKEEEVRHWYDGYLFGTWEVYNPWSVTKYVKNHVADPNWLPEPYWSNTSSNSIIKELVENASEEQRMELDTLIDGGTIEKQIHEDITYDDIHASEDNLWNFLFFTGYMKKVSERISGENIYLTMRIPNAEIRYIYRGQISTWFNRIVKAADRSTFYRDILSENTEGMKTYVTGLLKRCISTFDSEEAFYHGFLLSVLSEFPDYSARSNREEGDGRPDIVLYPLEPEDPVYIFEIKVRMKFNEMRDGIEEAFRQIRDRRYEEGILDDGYAGVISFGVCFCRKACIMERKKY